MALVIYVHIANFPLQNAANYVSESVQGGGATASKEANKEVAKDNDASLGSRASAAKDAIGDKADESSHNTKADVHKEAAKH
ncbi:glucose-repressible gene protein [Pleomassaria siparia CBS 279.74]|uniref:Glucose-repressible gene protein n=1 Tax=Pleomassaria siparia CBS 279.74 TaxID=1314801 RepID=A0A6G1JYP2_9PLEO|nr:glucose-repressible gene protein [Pleomassaria siparia CBS 279.74]